MTAGSRRFSPDLSVIWHCQMGIFYLSCLALLIAPSFGQKRTFIPVANWTFDDLSLAYTTNTLAACDCRRQCFSNVSCSAVTIVKEGGTGNTLCSFSDITVILTELVQLSTAATWIFQGRPCEEGWVAFQDSCYLFSAGQKGWEGAELSCIGHGSDLVKIDNAEEWKFVSTHDNTMAYWTGLNDVLNMGSMTWSSSVDFGSNNGDQSSILWAPNEPSGSGLCLSLRQEMGYAAHCGEFFNFICEIPIAYRTPSTNYYMTQYSA